MTNFEDKISGLKIKLERTLDPVVFNRVPLKTELTDITYKGYISLRTCNKILT